MTSIELQPKPLERGVAVSEDAVWTFFSVQLQERHKADGRLHAVSAAMVHTPCGAGAEQALEVGVLAICGRSASQPRRTVFAFGLASALVVCALAAWAYPRDPDFSLDATQRAFGSLGVFAVLAGACALACVWFPGSFCRATTSRCPLAHAVSLLIYCEDGSQHVAAVQTRTGADGITSCRCCNFRELRFVFDARADAFQVGDTLREDDALGAPLTQGLSEETAKQRRAWHGSNLILVPMPSLPRQAADEVLNPFVFFQFFSCVQWTLQAYWHYALIVLLITVIAAAVSLFISRQNFRRLRDLSHHEALVSVRRGGLEQRLLSTELVPGDVFVVDEGMDLPCDAMMVFGEALISEAMLTGESVPVAKVAVVPGCPASAKAQLFGGTRVLQTRALGGAAVLARCTRTGFSTEKGRLIRSILFPRSGRLDLTRDGNRFVAFVLLPMAVAGGIASCVHALQAGGAFTVASALDLVSIAVPPALPAAMMIGVATAVDRLRSRAIFCIAPNRVNMAGRITRVCFDKTGTLTYDGMMMLAVRPLMPDGATFGDEVSAPGAAMFADEVPAAEVPGACAVAAATTPQERMALVMAACQSLRLLGTSLVGDPLEVVMLESSGWALSTGDHDAVRVTAPCGKLCVSQLQTFDFNSELARMTVVVREEQSTCAPVRVRVLVKGSPEAVASLCDPVTLPSNFEAMLALYAGGGYRVLGCADRILAAEQAAAATTRSLARAEAEAAGLLRFVGLVVLENKLKPSSAGVIAALQAAAMNVCMITGDHARTAVTVGRAANILSRDARVVLCDASPGGPPSYTKLATALGEADEPTDAAGVLGTESESYRFVATGAGFDALLAEAEQGAPEALACVLKRLSIAARFQPHQKQRAVNLFIEGGEFTAFVGDGANDSAALKAADVGLSLTADAEASVAAAFTSKDAELVSCITLLLEGRAALATAFQLFRFMALYAAVQFSCSLQMDLADTYLSELQFLWVDMFVVLPLSGLLPQTRAYDTLSPRQPCGSLLHWTVIASVAGQAAVNLGFQLAIRALTRSQCWYRPQNFQCCSDTPPLGGSASQDSTCSLLPQFDASSCVTCGNAFASIVPGYENTALWHLANLQYLWLAAAFAISRPFRQPQWTNVPFSLSWLTLLGLSVAMLFSGSRKLDGWVELIPLPDKNFRWAIACLAMLSGLCTFGLEAAIEELQLANVSGAGPAALLRRVCASLGTSKRAAAYTPLRL